MYMQVINKGQANTLVFTLNEKVTLSSPVFLFEITNQVDNNAICFIAADTSSYVSWYNKFTVTEQTSGTNYLTGIISCPNTGQYNYRIFEQSSSTNLNPANATTLLETGIITVSSTQAAEVVYQPPKETGVIYGASQ